MPEDKDGHDDNVDGDGDDDDVNGGGDAYVGEELVDPVAGRVAHTARPLSPAKLEPLRNLPLGEGGFTECNAVVKNDDPGLKMQNISSKN